MPGNAAKLTAPPSAPAPATTLAAAALAARRSDQAIRGRLLVKCPLLPEAVFPAPPPAAPAPPVGATCGLLPTALASLLAGAGSMPLAAASTTTSPPPRTCSVNELIPEAIPVQMVQAAESSSQPVHAEALSLHLCLSTVVELVPDLPILEQLTPSVDVVSVPLPAAVGAIASAGREEAPQPPEGCYRVPDLLWVASLSSDEEDDEVLAPRTPLTAAPGLDSDVRVSSKVGTPPPNGNLLAVMSTPAMDGKVEGTSMKTCDAAAAFGDKERWVQVGRGDRPGPSIALDSSEQKSSVVEEEHLHGCFSPRSPSSLLNVLAASEREGMDMIAAQSLDLELTDVADTPSESCQSPQPIVLADSKCEDIDEFLAPVLQITEELHVLHGDSPVEVPSALCSFETLEVAMTPQSEPCQSLDSLGHGAVLVPSSDARFAKELCGLLASLEAASPGYGKEFACVLAGKASESMIKKVEKSLKKVSIRRIRRRALTKEV
nr:uncharacterized protein LOC127326636 [Lolium perenne]